jgi:hypothetical protein
VEEQKNNAMDDTQKNNAMDDAMISKNNTVNDTVHDKIRGQGETMGENGHLLTQLEQAGKLHGHICPSLFYGVSLALRVREWMQAGNRADSAAFEIILEGKSQCIRDGVRSVLGEGVSFTVQSTGQCALSAVCTTDSSTPDSCTPDQHNCTPDQHNCAPDQHNCAPDQHNCKDQTRYRLSISPAVRSRINEFNQSLPLEEFKRVGVAYLKSLSPRELFGE